MVGKAKWKLLELPLPRKTVNQKYCVPGRTDLKDAGVMIPTHRPIQLTHLAYAKDRWTLENDSELGCSFFPGGRNGQRYESADSWAMANVWLNAQGFRRNTIGILLTVKFGEEVCG